MDNYSIYQDCIQVIKDAGKELLKLKNAPWRIIRKTEFDLVTELDLKIQNYIFNKVKMIHDRAIISEEIRIEKHSEFSDCFVLDPIDGTHNLIAGLHIYGISLSYVLNKNVIFGITFFPELDILYHAYQNKGAYKNNDRIYVSKNSDLKKSIIAYDNQFQVDENMYKNFSKINKNIFTLRISGSALFDGCMVAEGVFDARILNNTKLCDIAASLILVKEAGGCVSDFIDREIDMLKVKDIIISSNSIHKEIIRCLK